MLSTYTEMLLSGKVKLGIWGLGYLGYSDLAKYAMNRISCVVSDYSKKMTLLTYYQWQTEGSSEKK